MIKSSLTIIFSSFLFAACCTCGNVNIADVDIPEKLQKKADEFIISKTGKEFFNNYIKPDYNKITEVKDGYLMVYSFSIPDKEGIDGEIRFLIDSLGNIKKDREIVGIPDCKSNSENCDFKISKDEAINLAQRAGLEEGIKDWEVKFLWSTEYEKYTWQIRTTLSETKGTEYYRGSGKIMLVEPGNGNIIETKEWRVN